MDRLLITFSLLFLICSFVADVAFSENKIEAINGSRKKVFWFGSRLDRRKRNPKNLEEGYRSNGDKEQLESLMEVIQDTPWAIIAINEGKRHTVNFTPRLGRESGEELVSNGVPNIGDKYSQDSDADLMSQRSPPFAPRLGRRMPSFSPRLGRENDRV